MTYLQDNAEGLVDYRLRLPLLEKKRKKLLTFGTVAGNIDSTHCRRLSSFKRRGMSWSKQGAHSLSKILVLQSNGKLADWMMRKKRFEQLLSPEIRQRSQSPCVSCRDESREKSSAMGYLRCPALTPVALGLKCYGSSPARKESAEGL